MWGRLGQDMRKVNNYTIEEADCAEDADELTRWLAAKLWRSQSDLVWGFNHLGFTRRAARIMQLATSIGILQPSVLGFGIHGGPAAIQKIVNLALEKLRKEGKAKAFIDDLLLGTGVAGEIEDPMEGYESDDADDGSGAGTSGGADHGEAGGVYPQAGDHDSDSSSSSDTGESSSDDGAEVAEEITDEPKSE